VPRTCAGSPTEGRSEASSGNLAHVDDPGFDLDLLASSLHADEGDVRILLNALVQRLAGALGSRLRVERGRGRPFSGSKPIERIIVTLGDDQLDAAIEGDGLRCSVARSSGGIRIRSARVPTEEWLRRLLGALRDEATVSEQTRLALESIVIGEP
jgi:hypothetical protein